jgi:SAM-dependent methyltransferase
MSIGAVELAARPEFSAFLGYLRASPVLEGSVVNLDVLFGKYGSEYLDFVEWMLGILKRLNVNAGAVFEEYIVQYMRDLAAFERTNSYNNGTFDEIRERVYDNTELMSKTYLPGQFLAYAATTLMHEKYRFFERAFSSRLSDSMVGSEVGFGDGFYLWRLLDRHPGLKVHGCDISPSALDFTAELLAASGVAPHRYQLKFGNACNRLPEGDAFYDWCVLAEVIEHVADPAFTLSEIRRVMKPGGLLYLATVIDANHMDHITNFADPEEIERMLTDSGQRVIERMVYKVNSEIKTRDRAVSVAVVCQAV